MELLHAGIGALIAATGMAFIGLVAAKAAAGLWVVTTLVGRALYWVTIGWWVSRIKRVVMGY